MKRIDLVAPPLPQPPIADTYATVHKEHGNGTMQSKPTVTISFYSKSVGYAHMQPQHQFSIKLEDGYAAALGRALFDEATS